MRILLTSDIHIDIVSIKNVNMLIEECDLIIIPGDISNETRRTSSFMSWITSFSKIPVLWTAGNHDYWDHNYRDKNLPKLSIEQSQRVYSQIPGFLNRTIREINGERILGCTMWYKLDGYQNWSDYDLILDSHTTIQKEAELDYAFLKENLRENDIVVTHMLPSFECVSSKFIHSNTNRYFVAYDGISVHNLIVERKPKLWLHGHTHERVVKTIEKTLVVCNPRGDSYSEYKDYTHLVIDTQKIGEYDCILDLGTKGTYK